MSQLSLQPVFLGLFWHAPYPPEDSGKSSRLNTCKNLCSPNNKEARPRELTQGENYYRSLAGNKFILILHMSNFFQISPRAAKIMIFLHVQVHTQALKTSETNKRVCKRQLAQVLRKVTQSLVVICSLTWDMGF